MTFGLQILNEGADVVIDADFRNFELLASGTVTHAGTGLTYTVSVTFTATARPPLIFARVQSGIAAHVACLTLTKDGSGNYSSAKFRTTDPFGVFGAFAIDWFAAAPVDSASAETVGLQVFDASGLKVFDSGARYVRFEDAVAIAPGDFTNGALYTADSGSAIPYTHASVADPYYCLSALRGFVLPGDGAEVPPAVYHPAVRSASATQTNVALVDESIVGSWSPEPYTRQSVPLILATLPP